jgi:zinc transporter 1/2/3
MAQDNILPRGLHLWSEVPTALLHAELARRQNDGSDRPACGSSKSSNYNTTIHVGALILILVLSVACKYRSVAPGHDLC